MDYDADGKLDMISGSYDPGDIHLFRGLGKGRYEKGRVIEDASGLRLVHHPVELARFEALPEGKRNEDAAINDRVASFGSWPAMVDWDGDGDLDMLIGSFAGNVWLRVNTGTRKRPVWAKESTAITAGGSRLDVGGHAAPVVADWDADGRWDLVVGAHDGSVSWFRNTGTEKEPALGERRVLVEAKSQNKFLIRDADEEPAPAVRAQICVTDYDGDGRLDLLLGDYADVQDGKERSRQSFVWLFRRVAPATSNEGS